MIHSSRRCHTWRLCAEMMDYNNSPNPIFDVSCIFFCPPLLFSQTASLHAGLCVVRWVGINNTAILSCLPWVTTDILSLNAAESCELPLSYCRVITGYASEPDLSEVRLEDLTWCWCSHVSRTKRHKGIALFISDTNVTHLTISINQWALWGSWGGADSHNELLCRCTSLWLKAISDRLLMRIQAHLNLDPSDYSFSCSRLRSAALIHARSLWVHLKYSGH